MKAFHDIHIHSYLSLCSSDNQGTAERYVERARSLGHRLMGFANHTWDESIPFPPTYKKNFYRFQSMAYQMQIKNQIPNNPDGMKILVGAETEYCGMFDILGMGKEAAMQLDYLLIPHTHLHMRGFVMPKFEEAEAVRENILEKLRKVEGIPDSLAKQMTDSIPDKTLEAMVDGGIKNQRQRVANFMVESFRSLMNNETLKTYSDLIPVSIAHPFQPISFPNKVEILKLIPDNTYGELFEMAARRGIGLEINFETQNDEDVRLFSIAKECGCKFTLGSDTHTYEAFDKIFDTEFLCDRVGLTEDDFMDFVRQ